MKKDFTSKQVLSAKPGRHLVSRALYLYVSQDGISRRYIHRYTNPRTRRITEMGLGSTEIVSLAEARERVREARSMVAKGQDPIEAKRHARRAGVTFEKVAEDYIVAREGEFRNP